jgi:ABC-type transport system substrate-binding protein
MEGMMSDISRYWSRSLPRRRFVQGGLAVSAGLAGAALVGCGGDDDSSSPATGTSPGGTTGSQQTPSAGGDTASAKYGGTFRLSRVGIETNLDPFMSQGTPIQMAMASERLFTTVPATLELRPGLIESYEEVEPGMEYILHVQPDAVWENKDPVNGRKFDADDVVHNVLYAGGYSHDNIAQRAGWYSGVGSVDSVDESTVRLRMDEPNGAILAAMADHRQQAIPREMPDQFPFEISARIPSVGPYLIERYDQGERAVGTKNPSYWRKDESGNQLPYFDGINIQWYGDNASAYAAFLANQLDMLPITARQAEEVESRRSDADIVTFPFRRRDFTLLNVRTYPDPRVWEAFHHLIDYQVMVEDIYLGNADYTGVVPPTFGQAMTSDQIKQLPGYNPDTRDQDIATAFQLLNAAGYPEGEGLEIHNAASASSGARFDWGIHIQGAIREVAPKIVYETRPPVDGPSFQRALLAGEHDAITHGASDGPDVRLSIQIFETGHSRNWSGFSDPEIDDLISRMQIQSGEELQESFSDFESRLIGGKSPIFGLGVSQTMAVASRIRGVRERGGFEGANNDIWINNQNYWIEE